MYALTYSFCSTLAALVLVALKLLGVIQTAWLWLYVSITGMTLLVGLNLVFLQCLQERHRA
ncbi:MAG: hypothetical protein M1438_05795 [Deltaproteobacteria bacterium]|nr:hypothetical protein [Deltaproteobacteria bacterium]